MNNHATQPFDSIESALEYMILFEGTILDVTEELKDRMDQAVGERSTQAYALALYKVKQLLSNTQRSRRILNDLRLIRGMMAGDSEPEANTTTPDSRPELARHAGSSG